MFTLAVNRGTDADYGWKAVDDFDNSLVATNNFRTDGIWSDGETMWVSNANQNKLFAYDMATKEHKPSEDFDTLDPDNDNPNHIWSDGETMWVIQALGKRIYAYNLATKARDASKDITAQDLGMDLAFDGITADGNTLWVQFRLYPPIIHAYDPHTLERKPSLDIDTFGELGYGPSSFWSDGTHMFVASASTIWALRTADGSEDNSRRFVEPGSVLQGNSGIRSIWSDGKTMWAMGSNHDDRNIYSFNLPPADDTAVAVLSVNGAGVAGLDHDETDYQHGVASTVTQATVAAKPLHRFATLEFGGTDADAGADGFQVNLSEGRNGVEFTVTAQNGDTEDYTLSVNRGVATDFGWKAVDDLDGVMSAAGNDDPLGVWSNRTTVWVADNDDKKIYAYDLDTGERDADRDFETLEAAGNEGPLGIWSDGTTMWVSDGDDNKLYAYNLTTKARDSDKDFDTLDDAGNESPAGIWSDSATMWVVDTGDAKLYAYNLSTKARDSGKDFATLQTAGNGAPAGLWSDGVTMWVVDTTDDKLYAYSVSDKAHDSDKDFTTLDAAGNGSPWGIWSNYSVMWVSDRADAKLYSYNMDRPAPNNLRAAPGNRFVELRWDSANDSTVSKYQYRTSAGGDNPEDSGWQDVPSSNAATTFYTATGLANGTEYTLRVRAVYSRGAQQTPGNAAEIRSIPRGPLASPESFAANPAGDGVVALSWDDPNDATITSYQYQYRNASDTGWNPGWTDVPGSSAATTSHTLSGLTNYLLYTFEVRAFREDTDTFGPAAQTSTTPRGPVTAPVNLTASSGEDRHSVLGWDAAIDDSIVKYQYRVSANGGDTWNPDWKDIPNSSWTTASHTVRGLTNLVFYTFEVRTARQHENGPAARTTATPEGPPSVPGQPVILDVAARDSELFLSWDAPIEDERAPITSYTVRYRRENSGSWTTMTGHYHPVGTSRQYRFIDGLTNNRHYDLQVAAVNRLGAGPWASTTGTPQPSATEPPPPPPSEPDQEPVALPELNVGPIAAYWTEASGSDTLHPDTRSSNSLYNVCDGTHSFKVYWEGPEPHPSATSHNILDEYEAHITTRGGAGRVNHWFDYEYGGSDYYGMYGTVSVRESSGLSVKIRGRYEGQGWGTWSKPVNLNCFQVQE